MVVYTGYCRPLKQKVEFSVSEVNPVETKRGIKWAVKGYYDNHKISTFASKADAEQLLSQMDSDDVEVFGAEIAYEEPKGEVKTMTGKPHTPRTLEEDKDITPEEARTKTQLKADDPYADLDPKYMTKDGKPDMRYKVCRDIKAKMMSAESLEDYTPEELATSNVNVGDITVDAGKGGYGSEEFNLEEFMAELKGYEKANSNKIKLRLLHMIQEISNNRLPHFSYKLEPTDEELHSIEDIHYDDISGTLKIYTTTNDDAKSNKEELLRQFNAEFKKGLMDLEQCIVIIEGLEGYFTGEEKWSDNADDDFYYCPKDLKDAETEYFTEIVHEVFEDYMDSKDKDTLKLVKENNFRVGLLETESGDLYDLSHETKMITDDDNDEPMFAFILTPNQNGEKTNLLDFYNYYRAWDEKSEEDEEEFFYKGLKMDFSPLNPEVGLVTIDMYSDDDEYTFQIDFDKKLIFFKGSFNEIEDDDDYDDEYDEDEEGDDTEGITYNELGDFVDEIRDDGFGHLPAKIGVWDREDEDQLDENYVIGDEILYGDGMVYTDDLDNDPLISAIPLESEESFDAETYQKVYTAEPDRIMFDEHIPPEIWNRMGPDQKGTYITTRDETMLIAPCCGVSKAEIRVDRDANADCESCCWMGDDFHPRWWADKERPTVTMEAEEFKMDSLSGNTATVPVDIYYKMMLEIPETVSAEKTDDGLSVIFGFHDQDVDYMEFLLDTYNPQSEDDSLVQGGEGYEAETYASTPLPRGWAEDVSGFRAETIASRDAERYESENFYSTSLENFYANVFSGSDKDSATTDFNGDVLVSENPDAFDKDEVSKMMADYEAETLQEWGDQEMITHGKDVSFENWLQEEVESHGDVDFMDWAEHEEESHEERYGAESFKAEHFIGNDKKRISLAKSIIENARDMKDYEYQWKTIEKAGMALKEGNWNQFKNNLNQLDSVPLRVMTDIYGSELKEILSPEKYNQLYLYGAESFEGESRPESYMVTSDVHELSKATDKLEELADPAKKYPEWWKSKLSVATDQADNLADYLEYANDSGELDRLQAEGFRSKMETYNKPKSKKMIWGLLGIGVGTALLAPNQIRELIKKYRK
jgi:hypothetical protein